MQTIRIPEDRIAVLLGTGGKTKRYIEKITKTELEVSEEAIVIDGDPLLELKAHDIVHAIGRGFSPEKALRLQNDDYVFILIHLADYASTSNSMHRLKGRIIGENGRSRRKIEKTTNTNISVYGKTIGIIGSYDDAEDAKLAIIKLLEGARHATVYRMLEKKTRP